jgi:hypothetical protein
MFFSQSGLKSIAVLYLIEGGLSSPNETNQDLISDTEATYRYEIVHEWSKMCITQPNRAEQMAKHTKGWIGPLLPSPKRLRRERIFSRRQKRKRIDKDAEYYRRSGWCTSWFKHDCHPAVIDSNRVSFTIRPILDGLQR